MFLTLYTMFIILHYSQTGTKYSVWMEIKHCLSIRPFISQFSSSPSTPSKLYLYLLTQLMMLMCIHVQFFENLRDVSAQKTGKSSLQMYLLIYIIFGVSKLPFYYNLKSSQIRFFMDFFFFLFNHLYSKKMCSEYLRLPGKRFFTQTNLICEVN